MRSGWSKQTAICLYSYSLALVLVLAGGCVRYYHEAGEYRRRLESVYVKSLEELTDYMTAITNTLTKGIYAGTPAQLTRLSAELWRDSGVAKSALAAIPAGETRLDAAYRFLSQVGDYALSLSSRATAGEELGQEERDTFERLLAYSQELTVSVCEVERRVRTGETALGDWGAPTLASLAAPEPAAGVFDEAGKLEGHASLIYDGPFSDHLLTREPKSIQNAPEITAQQALEMARKASGADELTLTGMENSTMEAYCFEGEGYSLGVTKRGGCLSYLTTERSMGGQRIEATRAVELAQEYLAALGLPHMEATYFESAEGVCTVNLAFVQDGTTCYPDLVKVGVALDNGAVVFVDARGYLVNHHLRELPAPVLSPEQGRDVLGSAFSELAYLGTAVIPTQGGAERFCYEYRATGRSGHRLLLYVDAATGEEAQILLLIETEGGVLTV